jgi:TolB protein
VSRPGKSAGPRFFMTAMVQMLLLPGFRAGAGGVSTGRIGFRSRALTHGNDFDPAWSSTARRIAFVRVRGGGSDPYSMNLHGHNVRRLTDDGLYESHPDWSPDGSQLVFTADDDVAVVDAAGGPITVLATTPRTESNAVFSPNGNRIVFDRCCFGPNDSSAVFVMNIDGTAVERMGRGSNPDWQPRAS